MVKLTRCPPAATAIAHICGTRSLGTSPPAMQIDLSQEQLRPAPITGWLEKKGSLRKNWKSRYFLLDGGTLRYYAKGPAKTVDSLEGSDMKGDVSLLGAEVSIVEGTQVNISARGDKKPNLQMRAKTNKEASEWHVAISKQIRFQNTVALHNQSRLPEVVEWYYQLQSELIRKHSFLLKNIEVYINFQTSQKADVNSQQVSVFNVCMTDDRLGLLLSSQAHAQKKANRMDSINNGRVISFVDITGAMLPLGGWTLTKENRFPFTLCTKEDDLMFEMDAMGVTWLQAVRDMVQFVRIPAPSGRTASTLHEGAAMPINALVEFSANSGAVFASSNDVQLILENLSRVTNKSPVIADSSQRISTILHLIPEMRCNKEAAMAFGERIEEMTRVLGDSEVGILFLSKDSDKSLLNFHLSTFSNKLLDVITFLSALTKTGWLAASITSKQHDNAKLRFETYDHDLSNIINTLIKAMSIAQAVLFDRKEYVMAVDVRRSVEALGGIEAIYRDSAKERALAKLIQSDGHEVHSELDAFIRNAEANMTMRSSRMSMDSYRTSMDSRGNIDGSSSLLSRLWGCCCCCFGGSTKAVDQRPGKNRKPRIQLEEPLIR